MSAAKAIQNSSQFPRSAAQTKLPQQDVFGHQAHHLSVVDNGNRCFAIDRQADQGVEIGLSGR